MSTDFNVLNAGSVIILTPITEAADDWVAEHIPTTDETQFWGQKGIVVEPRYIQPIIEGILGDDLNLEIAS